jgi:asparagine synthase (glutamine-hydrolysing)
MCGIALIAGLQADPASSIATLDTMHADLAGRGPDGEGWLVVGEDLVAHRFGQKPESWDLAAGPIVLGAAFRRLAVRDPRREAGQPIGWRGNALWVFHNGEIYNDADVRRDLAAEGAVFTTRNDAETIIAAYDRWGDACFDRLRGMWAAAIVDLASGRLVVCRDRLGIKPLFYSLSGNRIVIASHPRTVALALPGGRRVELSRWHRFLRGHAAADAHGSFFADVRAVPAGSILSFDLRAPADGRAIRHYWSLGACHAETARHDARAAAEELVALLETSTREHLVADRSLGCMLSGGLDSSIITCLAARAARRIGCALPTGISIVYDDPRLSEWPYIQSVAAHAGIKPVTHCLTAAEVWSLVDDVVAAQGEPLMGQDAIAHFRAFRLAREHGCVVALEGQAADELFAGMPAYEAIAFLDWMRSGAWGPLGAQARARARAQRRSTWSVLREYALVPAYRRWIRPRPHPPWLEHTGAAVPRPPAEEVAERSTDPSRLNRYLFDLVRHTNLPAVLLLQDRNAMAHGVENRPPFLDHRLVEWAFRQPLSAKVGGGRRKRILWDVARQVVPDLVMARTDKRAMVSHNDWIPLRKAHRDELADMAASRTLRQAPFVRGDRMTQFVNAYLRGDHDDARGVWRLYTGWRWLERFGPAS